MGLSSRLTVGSPPARPAACKSAGVKLWRCGSHAAASWAVQVETDRNGRRRRRSEAQQRGQCSQLLLLLLMLSWAVRSKAQNRNLVAGKTWGT